MIRIVTAGLLGLTLGSFASGATWYAPQVGEPHPDFVLPRIDTRAATTLSQFRGQKLLLIQFASW